MGNAATRLPYRVQSSEVGIKALIRPPVCIKDSCNPGGIASQTRVPCTNDDECTGGKGMLCQNHTCWIKPASETTCYGDGDCRALNTNNSGQGIARCLLDSTGANGACIFKDLARARSGHVCNADVDCSMGTCDTANKQLVTNLTYCAGGCACDQDHIQDSDNTTPLGFVCNKTGCENNPCNKRADNNNKCTSISTLSPTSTAGSYTCTCDANWEGANCMNLKKGLLGWPCQTLTENDSCKNSLVCSDPDNRRGGVCSVPTFETNDMTKFPWDRCPAGMNRSAGGWFGDSHLPTIPCILTGSAPNCDGDHQVDCETIDGGNVDMVLVARTGRRGQGFKSCNSGLFNSGFKGLCAPAKCETDSDCKAHKCCPATMGGGFGNTCWC